jgi:hypothetical protein
MLQAETDTVCALLNERVAKEISTTDGISGTTKQNRHREIHYSKDEPNNGIERVADSK